MILLPADARDPLKRHIMEYAGELFRIGLDVHRRRADRTCGPRYRSIALGSMPRSAKRVLSVRRPLCDDAPGIPASAKSVFRNRAIEPGVIAPPF
jgi:hypothetical protein